MFSICYYVCYYISTNPPTCFLSVCMREETVLRIKTAAFRCLGDSSIVCTLQIGGTLDFLLAPHD